MGDCFLHREFFEWLDLVIVDLELFWLDRHVQNLYVGIFSYSYKMIIDNFWYKTLQQRYSLFLTIK